MVAQVGNWVGESTITQGTGDITLDGPFAGFTTFSSIADSSVFYVIQDGNNRESGTGTLSGSTLVRTTVHATLVDGLYSEVDTPISLSGGASVFCSFGEEAYRLLRDHTHPALMPAGGGTGQVLSKVSATDFDSQWVDDQTGINGLPAGGTAAQVLAKNSNTDYDVLWKDDDIGGLEVVYHVDAATALTASQGDGGVGLHVAPD